MLRRPESKSPTSVTFHVSRGKKYWAYLANIHPPDIIQGTSSQAVNTFTVVGPNDNIGQNRTSLKHKHSIGISTLSLIVASRN
jgi:hypothetical protein